MSHHSIVAFTLESNEGGSKTIPIQLGFGNDTPSTEVYELGQIRDRTACMNSQDVGQQRVRYFTWRDGRLIMISVHPIITSELIYDIHKIQHSIVSRWIKNPKISQ